MLRREVNNCSNSLTNVIKCHWMNVPSSRILWKAVLMYQCCGDVAAWTLAQVNIIWVNILLLSQPRSHRPLIFLKVGTHCRNFSTLTMYTLGYMCVCLCVWIGALGSLKIHFTSIQILQNSNMDAFGKYFMMIFFIVCSLLLNHPIDVFFLSSSECA